jgi:hypothetical protein
VREAATGLNFQLLIIEVFARFALSGEVTRCKLLELAIDRVCLSANAFVGLPHLSYNSLDIGVAPRLFYIIRKLIKGHFVDNQIVLDEVTYFLEDAYVLFNLYVTEFPSLASFTA